MHTCLEKILVKSSRPKLAYLTQAGFNTSERTNKIGKIISVRDKEGALVIYSISTSDNYKYLKAISKLPLLVQAAEILFDKTVSNPDSIEHMFVKELLESLREE